MHCCRALTLALAGLSCNIFLRKVIYVDYAAFIPICGLTLKAVYERRCLDVIFSELTDLMTCLCCICIISVWLVELNQREWHCTAYSCWCAVVKLLTHLPMPFLWISCTYCILIYWNNAQPPSVSVDYAIHREAWGLRTCPLSSRWLSRVTDGQLEGFLLCTTRSV